MAYGMKTSSVSILRIVYSIGPMASNVDLEPSSAQLKAFREECVIKKKVLLVYYYLKRPIWQNVGYANKIGQYLCWC